LDLYKNCRQKQSKKLKTFNFFMGHAGLISLTVSYRLHIIQKAKNEKVFASGSALLSVRIFDAMMFEQRRKII